MQHFSFNPHNSEDVCFGVFVIWFHFEGEKSIGVGPPLSLNVPVDIVVGL